jgi:hypothetical protein
VFAFLEILFDTPFKIVLSRIMVRTSEPLHHFSEIIIAGVRMAIQTTKTLSTHFMCHPYLNGHRRTMLTGFVIII